LNLHGKAELITVNERTFYEKIVRLPYMSNTYFKLFEQINTEDIVEDLVDEFREIYLPIINEQIKDNFITFDKTTGNFIITNTKQSRRFFAENLNYEILKCMHLVLKHCIVY
jgi:hypothetical protein